jgi:hypothetical protein
MANGTRSASLVAVAQRWLDDVFWAGMELSVLAIPALLLLLGATPAGPVALSALSATITGSAAVATFRGNYVGAAEWPPAGDVYSMAGRSAYYSLVVAAGTFLGVTVNVALGSYWAGVLVPLAVVPAALAPLPVVLVRVRTLSRTGVDAAWP